MANLIVSAVSTFDNKGLKKGQKEISAFEKQVKSFGKIFAGVFSATALLNYSNKAIKAFSDDQAAAKRLELQLQNTGNAFRVDEVEGYIKSLEKTNAILTDLRAPFQTLLNLTGSVELAQRSLESALDISAGTGENLDTVISAIASGIRGQTKAIKNLNTGIDANIIATGDMNKIMEALDKRFSGQAAARLDTYAGKMDVLKKGADEATKAIGQGLVESLELLGKDNSLESVSNSMMQLATDIGNVTYAISFLISKAKGLAESLGLENVSIKMLYGPLFTILNQLGETQRLKDIPAQTANQRENRLNLKFTREVVKYNKILADQLKKKTEVDKLAEKFDLERIALMKALGEATDAETKLRIEAKLAILDNNEALAKKINAELEAAKKAAELATAFGSATQALVAQMGKLQTAMDSAFNAILAKIATAGFKPPESLVKNLPLVDQLRVEKAVEANKALNLSNPAFIASMASERQAVSAISGGGNQFSLSFDTTFTGDRFAQLIAESLQLSEKTGYSTAPAGSIR